MPTLGAGPFTPPQYTLAQAPTFDMGAVITAVGVTADQKTPDFYAQNFKGITVVLDMTTVGTGSVTLSIQGKDSASGKYFTLLAGAAVVSNVTNVYTLYPGIVTTTNVSISGILPAVFRILVTANNANPTTYTVGAVLTT